MFRKKWFDKKNAPIEVQVLCKLWFEDGVWNASAQDLPVAVCGDSVEEAKANLLEALTAHFHALQELGKVEKVIKDLCRIAEARLSFAEIPNDQFFWKTTILGEMCGGILSCRVVRLKFGGFTGCG